MGYTHIRINEKVLKKLQNDGFGNLVFSRAWASYRYRGDLLTWDEIPNASIEEVLDGIDIHKRSNSYSLVWFAYISSDVDIPNYVTVIKHCNTCGKIADHKAGKCDFCTRGTKCPNCNEWVNKKSTKCRYCWHTEPVPFWCVNIDNTFRYNMFRADGTQMAYPDMPHLEALQQLSRKDLLRQGITFKIDSIYGTSVQDFDQYRRDTLCYWMDVKGRWQVGDWIIDENNTGKVFEITKLYKKTMTIRNVWGNVTKGVNREDAKPFPNFTPKKK